MKLMRTSWFYCKKYCYLVFLFAMALPYIAIYLGYEFAMVNLFTFLPVLTTFIILPIVDYLLGTDNVNPLPEEIFELENDYYYRVITLLCLPLIVLSVVFGAYFFTFGPLNWWGKIGWLLSIGTINGSIGIMAAHELIHKNVLYERIAGGLILVCLCFSSFKIEHIRSHHALVATEEDISSAKVNQSLYNFLRKSILGNFINAWSLEAYRLHKLHLPTIHWHNELIRWYGLIILLIIFIYWLFGPLGLIFFVLQSLIAIFLSEATNYIEHYGLVRKKLASGYYEPISEMHSWSNNFLLSNLLLFQLQRHADHHLQAQRRFQILLHHEKSPLMPTSYAVMLLLALFPPLWFRIINPRVPKH